MVKLSKRYVFVGILLLLSVNGFAQDQDRLDDELEIGILLDSTISLAAIDELIDQLNQQRYKQIPVLRSYPPLVVRPLLRLRAKHDLMELMQHNPAWSRTKLERYLVLHYPASLVHDNLLAELMTDPVIVYAHTFPEIEFSSDPLVGAPNNSDPTQHQWGLHELDVLDAQNYNPGHGLVGVIDSGLATEHEDLRAFDDNGNYVGGNFLTVGSLDVSPWPDIDFNVDEKEPVLPVYQPHSNCEEINGTMIPSTAGHGTHVSGIIAATKDNGLGGSGVCTHCGLYMWKVKYHNICYLGKVIGEINETGYIESISYLAQIGAQVISMSFGGGGNVCEQNPNDSVCLALTYANSTDVTIIAAAGNNKTTLNFPASDNRAVAVGGINHYGAFWEENPCPSNNNTKECGSNYSYPQPGPKQELVAPARDVLSAFYPNAYVNKTINCSDESHPSVGYGLCRGTSMATPFVSGLAGILRSTNPLLPVGDPENQLSLGIRDAMVMTTQQAQFNIGWHSKKGYGIPDAEEAVKLVLGKVNGQVVKNRLTPLFTNYGEHNEDYAQTTSPNKAVSFILNDIGQYQNMVGTSIDGFYEFSIAEDLNQIPTPKAHLYVMTTPNKTQFNHPNLVPLYTLSISRKWPINCNENNLDCNPDNRDFVLVTKTSDIELLHDNGYEFYGREGYLYQPCQPEPNCIPEGAERIYRLYNQERDDHIVVGQSQLNYYKQTLGYNDASLLGNVTLLGYGYAKYDNNDDRDNDGLFDGFELLIGTDINSHDSDCDGIKDGVEFPQAAISLSDPLDSDCSVGFIFTDGFESQF